MKCWGITPLKASIRRPGEMGMAQRGKATIAKNKTKMLKPNATIAVCFWTIVNYFNIWKHSVDCSSFLPQPMWGCVLIHKWGCSTPKCKVVQSLPCFQSQQYKEFLAEYLKKKAFSLLYLVENRTAMFIQQAEAF